MSERGLTIALAIFSLALPFGWSWFKHRSANRGSWLEVEEQWPGATARFFYFVGLPYLALLSGVLAARFLGLKGLEHFIFAGLSGDFSIPLFLAEFQKAMTLLLLECLIDGGTMIQAGLITLLILAGLRLGLARAGLAPATDFHQPVLSTVYDGLHWAFYRAIFWQLSGDLYLGVVWGVAWVLLEWTLTAWAQRNWLTQQRSLLLRTILLILTATLFFYSPNLWLLWLVHLAMVVTLTLRLHRRVPGEYLPHKVG
jgi:hypothetical protein